VRLAKLLPLAEGLFHLVIEYALRLPQLSLKEIDSINSSFNKMKNDISFTNVLSWVLLGAVFAASAIGFQEWRPKDAAPVSLSDPAQQQSYDSVN